MSFEVWFTLTIFILGVFAAGHLIGYHKGWTDGYSNFGAFLRRTGPSIQNRRLCLHVTVVLASLLIPTTFHPKPSNEQPKRCTSSRGRAGDQT